MIILKREIREKGTQNGSINYFHCNDDEIYTFSQLSEKTGVKIMTIAARIRQHGLSSPWVLWPGRVPYKKKIRDELYNKLCLAEQFDCDSCDITRSGKALKKPTEIENRLFKDVPVRDPSSWKSLLAESNYTKPRYMDDETCSECIRKLKKFNKKMKKRGFLRDGTFLNVPIGGDI